MDILKCFQLFDNDVQFNMGHLLNVGNESIQLVWIAVWRMTEHIVFGPCAFSESRISGKWVHIYKVWGGLLC